MITESYIEKCNRLHAQAMEKVDAAFIAKHKAEEAEAAGLYREAYELESQAADLLRERKDFEPTRSVLYRSTASLALQIGELDRAFEFALEGLAGNPPGEIEEELREILIDVCPGANITDLMNL